MKEDSNVGNEIRRIAVGLMALSMRLDTYAMQRGLTMDSAHPKDPDPKNWRTINGSKVHLTEGKIDGGAGGKFVGKEWTGKAKHEFIPKEKPKESLGEGPKNVSKQNQKEKLESQQTKTPKVKAPKQQKMKTSGQFQTKTMSKPLFKADTGVSTPKGTLCLYASNSKGQITDPAFEKFESEYGKKQVSKFSEAEEKSVNRYTEGSKHLREYLCYGKVEGWGEYTKEALQEKVDNISSGLSKMEHPDMWVCRKCTLMDWATKHNPHGATIEDLQKMQEHGLSFENKAFLSTTPTEGGTYGDQGAKAVVRHFFVPEKATGGYIASVSSYKCENEFLLDKGTKTRIMKIEKQGGKIITYEEVVLDD